MKCDVCQGGGKLGALSCGRCNGTGRKLNYALFDVVAFLLLVAGVAGAFGYVAVVRQAGPAEQLERPTTGTIYHRVHR